MNVIQKLIEKLKPIPGVRYEIRQDAIRVLAPDSNGYEVALLMLPEGGMAVYFAAWHMEFTDENSAVGTFLGGLSDMYCLKVTSGGGVDYRWTILYREPTGWREGSTVVLARHPFFQSQQVRYLLNQLIPSSQQR